MKIYRLLTLIVICLISTQVVAQKIDYDKEWKKVENLLKKEGIPQSALTEVKKIYAAAKAEKKDAQVIKALVYMSTLQEQTREENLILSIREAEAEILQASEPARSILKSYLATKYLQYFQYNRYKLYDRTTTTEFNKNKIETWSARDLHSRISSLFLESIANAGILKQTRLDLYEPIILKGNSRHLRPTLFDLLSHQAINYFRNDERMIQKPAYAFEIDQEEAFAPAREFAAHKFITKDSLSLHHKALLIFQDLIAFHMQQKNAEALIDVDLERLQFVRSHSTHPEKDELYQKALQNIINNNKGRISYQAQYLLAVFYEGRAYRYDPFGDTTNRLDRVRARNILLPIVADSSVKNEGWTNSYNLLQQIETPFFSFEVERVNLPARPSRVMVQYRNADRLYFRVVRMTQELKKLIDRGMDEKYWSAISSAPSVMTWQQQLPNTSDYQQHRVEIKMDALPLGEYVLLSSLNEKINLKQGRLGSQVFHVSNISYLQSENIFFVLHRESGEPLNKAKADVFTRNYNYNENRYTKQKQGSYTVNEKGYFTITKSKDHQNYWIDIVNGADTLSINENYYTYQYYNEEREQPGARIIYFTDRSLYRPAQKVFFKGIALARNKTNSIITNHKTKIYLRDANYQLIDSLEVTTNEFGSFSGSFQLPSNVLTGNYFLTDKEDMNSISFSVEEYKRPKFFVEYEKVKESYKLGESIRVNGSARAYAGNTVPEAKVNYRVVRQARFPYPWWGRSWFPTSAPMEIANGEISTDKDGKFSFSFTAIPDKKVDPKFDPIFSYVISVDITDQNGETRSASKTISAGYKSLVLETSVPAAIHKDSLRKLNIRTENLNGEYLPSVVKLSFTRLIPENRLIRKRYWQRPDQFIMSKDEFLSYFPNDEYDNETDPKTWKKGEVVFTKQDSTRSDGTWELGQHNIAAGTYEIEIITKDHEGKEVKKLELIEVFEPGKIEHQQYLVHRPATGAIEPGQTATSFIGSSAPVYLVRYIDRKENKGLNENIFNYHRSGNGISSFTYTATENDRGGFGVIYFFVKDNRVYMVNETIHVPWTNKQLDISYASFRDKTLPGSEEKWKITIKGLKNEKVTAEMLASMYDASLDQFKPHRWDLPSIWPLYSFNSRWNTRQNFTSVSANVFGNTVILFREFKKEYDKLMFGFGNQSYVQIRGLAGRVPGLEVNQSYEEVTVSAMKVKRESAAPPMDAAAANGMSAETTDTTMNLEGGTGEVNNPSDFQVRKNFNETAFFFPHLFTDKDGNIEFTFTIPEALTRWKFQAFAHTKEMAMSVSQKEIITQKELMVQTNAPRFLRQGDRIEFTTKIANLSEKELTGQVELLLFNATTGAPVDGWFMNSRANQYFTVAAGGSASVSFPLQVPYEFNDPLTWRIVAKSGSYSDGEENILPVLTNKVLVTETLPIHMRGNGEKNFSFDKLKYAGGQSLQHHALTVEYTTNPAWFAVQALPYLDEPKYENAEQVWNRYYANALASKIANTSARLRQVFEKWKNTDTAALISNLQKNQELKNILLEETPWVMAAKSETEQKRNIALLFDMIRMGNELKAGLEKLRSFQSPNGGFVWFKGGPDDRYMTQYIVTGIGHLAKLGVDISSLQSILNTALPYLDRKIKEDHDRLIKSKANLSKQQVSYIQIQYLYMRSFFKKEIPSASKTAYNYYLKQAKQFWVSHNKYMQGMIALAVYRSGDQQLPGKILASLKETSIANEELGRYWKDVRYGYSWYWWHAPIETQSLLIEAFSEIAKDNITVDELKTWLVKNKQTTHWRTSKATADACYAMLLQGSNWIEAEPTVRIALGNTVFDSGKETTEAGTGYFKKRIEGSSVVPTMGNISVVVQPGGQKEINSMPSWGAVYWQYFEDMDKVESASTPLQINKKLFIKKNSDRGPVLQPIAEGTELNIGDRITVRVEIKTDRDMEYVHMKDMRASSLEPENVLSGYKWKGGLGYYESTRDASTNFFFSYLPKGNYVFEYDLFVSHKGSFSNGITTIQCLYAPEFSAHSEGVKIRVE